jgi:hypothetical protein
MFRRLICGFALVVAAPFVAFAQGLPVPSGWENQRGSILKVVSSQPDGRFSGVFINYAPGYQCQGIPYDVAGKSAGARVVFTVNFTDCRTITTWRGRAAGATMPTRWVLRVAGGPPQRGADVFTRRW